MTDKYINGLLNEFFNCLEDRLVMKRLTDLYKINGFGACTCAACMTSYGLMPNDEDYFGKNSVKITFIPPLCKEDFSFIVTNKVFLAALGNHIEKYLKRHPEDTMAAKDLIRKIREKMQCQEQKR